MNNNYTYGTVRQLLPRCREPWRCSLALLGQPPPGTHDRPRSSGIFNFLSTRCRDPSQRCCSSRFPLHFPRTKKDPAHRPDHFFVVEVPGIEPGSLGEDLVILRAQFALAFLCPDVHANKMSTGTVTVRFSVRTRDRFRW